MLCEAGIPATFFIPTANLDEPSEFWWDALERILIFTRDLPATLPVDLDGRPVVFATATPRERALARAALSERMITMSCEDRDDTIECLRKWSGTTLAPPEGDRSLRSAEVVSLAGRPGHSIGAHGVHHLFLPSQPLGVRLQEIVDSKVRLQRLLGRPVTEFAYPYGGVDLETVEMVRAAGLAIAVTAEEGLVRPGADALRLARYEVTGAESQTFDRALAALVAAT